MDVHVGCKEKMTSELCDAWEFLRANVEKEGATQYGVTDNEWIHQVTTNWFDDKNNYDGRWKVISDRVPQVGKILDMSSGCGTFVLHGLNKGYDVWGIEPELWKRKYYQKKIIASNYSIEFLHRICAAVGEELPYAEETFDLITTYQTLEHVQNVKKCLEEMLRVLKKSGILYIRAPNYNSFYEPHYRIPFFPKMNKNLAAKLLRTIGKPIDGLKNLNWITEKQIIEELMISKCKVSIERQKEYYSELRKDKIKNILPEMTKNKYFVSFLNSIFNLKIKIISMTRFGREENHIDLWVKKIS